MDDLSKRLKAATGPDREIDCLLHELEQPAHTPAMRGMYYGEPTGEYFEPNPDHPGGYFIARAPAVTASLDAALAMAERMVPGSFWRVEKLAPSMTFDGEPYWASCGDPGAQEAAHAKTAPLAVLNAAVAARTKQS